MFDFKMSKELREVERDNLQQGKEIKCFSTDIIHKTKMFYTFLFSNVEDAKRLAEKHAEENSRLKVRYVITDGTLKSNIFKSGYNSTIRFDGEKSGKIIVWS